MRLAELEQHVVGDVDDGLIGAGPRAAGARCIHSGVARVLSMPRITRACEARGSRAPASTCGTGAARRRRGRRHAQRRRAAARLPVSAATSRAMPSTDMRIAAIRRDVQLEDRRHRGRRYVAQRPRPRGASAGSSMMPSAALGEAELLRRAQHAGRFDAAQLRRLDGQVARQRRADRGQRASCSPARAFGAPQTICSGSPLPALTWQTRSLSACGCGATPTISATTTPENAGAAGSTRFDLEARASSAGAPVRCVAPGHVDPFAQPGQRQLHDQPPRNCARKRRSFSKNSRRSLTP